MERKYEQSSFINKHFLKWIVPLILILALLFLKKMPAFIEKYYSNFIYQYISAFLRFITGKFEYSIGDIFYILAFIFGSIVAIKKIIYFIKSKPPFLWFWNGLKKLVYFLLWLYIFFLIVWGLNYNRKGLSLQLQLPNTNYTLDELKDFTCQLQDRINSARMDIGDSNFVFDKDEQQINLCIDAYKQLAKEYSFFEYNIPSAKKSLLYHFVSSAGYSGYYNPFSGEAQINEDVPNFYKGFVIAHEMGHQIGYASESEASFSGYLACMYSQNKILQYSALYELFNTANSELFLYDAMGAYLNLKDLHPFVKYDRRVYRKYLLGKKSTFEPIIKNVYHQYLKANDQQNGIESYNDVVAWVLAYEKKYGNNYKIKKWQ